MISKKGDTDMERAEVVKQFFVSVFTSLILCIGVGGVKPLPLEVKSKFRIT